VFGDLVLLPVVCAQKHSFTTEDGLVGIIGQVSQAYPMMLHIYRTPTL
jgi:hypothetical protein